MADENWHRLRDEIVARLHGEFSCPFGGVCQHTHYANMAMDVTWPLIEELWNAVTSLQTQVEALRQKLQIDGGES